MLKLLQNVILGDKMVNIQDIKKKMNENNNYLIIRFVIYLLIVIVSIDTLYISEGITSVVYFNTIMLFAAPLLSEYIWGIQCYSIYSKCSKSVGFILSSILFIVAGAGMMGLAYIKVNENTLFIEGVYLSRINFPLLWAVRLLPFLCVVCTLADCIFSFGEEERVFFDLTQESNEAISSIIESKKHKLVEEEKKKMEKQYREKLFDTINNNV